MNKSISMIKKVLSSSRKIWHVLFIPFYILVVLALVLYNVAIGFICGSLCILAYSNYAINAPYYVSEADPIGPCLIKESLHARMLTTIIVWVICLSYMIIIYGISPIVANYNSSIVLQNYTTTELIVVIFASTVPFLTLSVATVFIAYRYKNTVAPIIATILMCFSFILPLLYLVKALKNEVLLTPLNSDAIMLYISITVISVILLIVILIWSYDWAIKKGTDGICDCKTIVVYSDFKVEKFAKSISEKYNACVMTDFQFLNTHFNHPCELFVILTKKSYECADMRKLLSISHDYIIKKMYVMCNNFTIESDTCKKETEFISSILERFGNTQSVCILSDKSEKFDICYISDKFKIKKVHNENVSSYDIIIMMVFSPSGIIDIDPCLFLSLQP